MLELDLLRGFAVAVMILVVSPGAWEYTYIQMQHADWHGWHLADFVFPDFLFGVGMALGLTFDRAQESDGGGRLDWRKVTRRVALLIALGLFLNCLYVLATYLGKPPIRPDDGLRIPGVLQRIAICYLAAVLILHGLRGRPRVAPLLTVTGSILLAYWALMTFVPVPGFGAGQLDQEGNLAAWIDRAVFTPKHMWGVGSVEWAGPVVYDPEGLMSTLPALANVLFGVVAVRIWNGRKPCRFEVLLGIGAGLLLAGHLLDPVFPINKKIWTSTFALVTSGTSFLALLAATAWLRSGPAKHLARPLIILGQNAIIAFALSIVVSVAASIPLDLGGDPLTAQQLGMWVAQGLMPDPYLASLLCAFTVLASIFLAVWLLHRRGIMIRL